MLMEKKTFVCCHQLSWQDDEKRRKKNGEIYYFLIYSANEKISYKV